MKSPVSLRQIAEALGLSRPAVSLGLRNHPGIPDKTRRRIHAMAKKMGYVPNPNVSQLMAEIRRHEPARYRGTLAWVEYHAPESAGAHREMARIGASGRAKQLGYQLETFLLGRQHLSRERLNNVLEARGIVGVLVAPLPGERHHLVLDWDRLSGVAIGWSLKRPLLPRVSNHHFHSVETVLRELRRRGFLRIGVCVNSDNSLRTDHAWLAGALVYRWVLGAEVSTLLIKDWRSAATKHRVRQWITRNHLEAVVSPHATLPGFLEELGFAIPDQLAFACLDVPPGSTPLAGISQRHDLLGATGVDLLVAQLHRNETAASTLAATLHIEGRWVDGASVPARAFGKFRAQ